MKDWVKVAFDCGLLNYVDRDKQNYVIDAYADVYTIRQFVHNLTADLVAENERLRALQGLNDAQVKSELRSAVDPRQTDLEEFLK
jgi:hydroxylamine reductase (hybrid-cluster protein)